MLAAYAALSVRAFVAVPLVKGGRLMAYLYAADPEPRAWSEADTALMREVAERTWSSVARARAEAELRESEARLSAIFAQASAGIALSDLDGRFTLVNDRYCGIVGRTREELTSGLRMQDLTLPDDLPANLAPFEALAARGPAFDIEKRYVRPDGGTVWVRNSVTGVQGRAGAVVAVLAVSIDITGRKAAEAALAESEARFRNLADNAPVMVWVTGPDAACTYLSRSWYEFTGQTEETGLGFGWLDATHPDDRAEAERVFLAANAAREPFRLEYRLRRADGAYRWGIDAAAPRFGAGGEFLGYVGSVIDITERKAAEDELQRLNETLEQRVQQQARERDRVWQVSHDLLGVATFEGYFVSSNPAWAAVLGWSEAEVRRTPFLDLVHPDDRAATAAELERLATGVPTLRFENRYRTRDGGYRWLSWTAVPNDVVIYTIARDITAEREAAQALRQAEEALRQAQKMEAVGQLTGGIAHDFNNLLQGIVGGLELLQRRVEEGRLDDVRRFADAATASARRAASLVQRLLAFARRQPLDPRPVDANRLVASMEDLLRRTLGPAVGLETVLDPGLWPAACDPNQLESALLNLAINARDAMPEGGRLTVETRNARLDEAYCRARGDEVRPGRYVAVSVADTGTGMPPDVVAKAFDPFFTTKPVGQGTGLGLSSLYGFAKQSGGHVTIRSEVGLGTTVDVYLPAHHGGGGSGGGAADLPDSAPPAVDGSEAAAGQTVLVVEDEAVVRMLVVDVLEELGHAALEAADGPSGLAILRSAARVDLLVTDIGLPGLDGRQLAQAAREHRPDLKVLFITGYPNDPSASGIPAGPGTEMIPKPFAVDALAEKVRGLLGSR